MRDKKKITYIKLVSNTTVQPLTASLTSALQTLKKNPHLAGITNKQRKPFTSSNELAFRDATLWLCHFKGRVHSIYDFTAKKKWWEVLDK